MHDACEHAALWTCSVDDANKPERAANFECVPKY